MGTIDKKTARLLDENFQRSANEALSEQTTFKRIEKIESIYKTLEFEPTGREAYNLYKEIQIRYLKDCVALNQYEKAKDFLGKYNYSPNDKKALLETVVKIYLHFKETKSALDWIRTVSLVFGVTEVQNSLSDPLFSTFKKSKTFQKYAGPEAERTFFEQNFKEVIRMWKKNQYDNLKDAIEDAKNLSEKARKFGNTHITAAKKHLDEVLVEANREASKDKTIGEYLKGII